jgi:hypothetical protein
MAADSRLLSDRSSIGAGLTHTLGALSMGSTTLTVEPGENATSGTAGIVLGNVVLSGDPVLAIHNKSGATGKLAVGALIGGGLPRAISKSGAGILSVTGGATSLPAGSTFSASGGGTVEMDFAPLGSNATVLVTSAQNPFGEADLTLIDTKLRMLARGSGGISVQAFVLPTQLTLGGDVTLDPDHVVGFGGSNKTFELGGMSLNPGAVLSMSGDNSHGIRLTTPLILQGNAVLKGTADVGKDGLLTLAGGMDGNATSSVVIGGGHQRDQSQDQCREQLRRRHDRQRRYDHPQCGTGIRLRPDDDQWRHRGVECERPAFGARHRQRRKPHRSGCIACKQPRRLERWQFDFEDHYRDAVSECRAHRQRRWCS